MLTLIRSLASPRLLSSVRFCSGLDNAGKSTILNQFNGEPIDTVAPTLGFNIKTLEYQNYKLNVWDVGGTTAAADATRLSLVCLLAVTHSRIVCSPARYHCRWVQASRRFAATGATTTSRRMG